MHMKINNNLGGKFLKDYNNEASHNHKLGFTEHGECLWQLFLPILFAQVSGTLKDIICESLHD